MVKYADHGCGVEFWRNSRARIAVEGFVEFEFFCFEAQLTECRMDSARGAEGARCLVGRSSVVRLTWWRVRCGGNRFWSVVSQSVSAVVCVGEGGCLRDHGCGGGDSPPVVRRREIGDGLVGVDVVPRRRRRVRRVVAP